MAGAGDSESARRTGAAPAADGCGSILALIEVCATAGSERQVRSCLRASTLYSGPRAQGELLGVKRRHQASHIRLTPLAEPIRWASLRRSHARQQLRDHLRRRVILNVFTIRFGHRNRVADASRRSLPQTELVVEILHCVLSGRTDANSKGHRAATLAPLIIADHPGLSHEGSRRISRSDGSIQRGWMVCLKLDSSSRHPADA